jgi:hypothetical protein
MIAARRSSLPERRPEFMALLEVLYRLTTEAQAEPQRTIAEVAQRHQLSLDDAGKWFSDVRWAVGADLPLPALEQARQTLQDLNLL